MDSENNIDNYALYIFLFLSTLSVGNDFYHVYSNMLENDFVKKNISKMNDYYTLMQNVLCNNVKKIKNKIVLEKINNKKNNENLLLNENKINITKIIQKKEKKNKKNKKDLPIEE